MCRAWVYGKVKGAPRLPGYHAQHARCLGRTHLEDQPCTNIPSLDGVAGNTVAHSSSRSQGWLEICLFLECCACSHGVPCSLAGPVACPVIPCSCISPGPLTVAHVPPRLCCLFLYLPSVVYVSRIALSLIRCSSLFSFMSACFLSSVLLVCTCIYRCMFVVCFRLRRIRVLCTAVSHCVCVCMCACFLLLVTLCFASLTGYIYRHVPVPLLWACWLFCETRMACRPSMAVMGIAVGPAQRSGLTPQ